MSEDQTHTPITLPYHLWGAPPSHGRQANIKTPPECDPLQVVHDLDAHLANWEAEGALSYRLWYMPPTSGQWARQMVVAPRLKTLVDALTLGGVKYLTIEKKVHSRTYTQRETKYLTRKGF